MAILNLPRELLWTDKTEISDFMSNEMGNDVISIFSFAKSRITIAKGTETMLKLYNEAFYLSTRIVYEQDNEANPETYREKILDDIGNKEDTEHVILLMFVIITLQSNKSKEILQFADKLQKEFLPQLPFRIIKFTNKIIKLKKRKECFELKPCPYPTDKLQEIPIDWNKITQGFSKQVILDILDLWKSDNEKGKVIRMIEQAYTSCLPVTKDEGSTDRADESFFAQQMILYNVANDENKTNNSKGGRPESKSLDELFTESCSPAQREKLIDVVRSLIGKEAVYTLRVAALADVGVIKKVPSYSKVKEVFPNIGASSNFYKQKGLPMTDDEIEYYKRLLEPQKSNQEMCL